MNISDLSVGHDVWIGLLWPHHLERHLWWFARVRTCRTSPLRESLGWDPWLTSAFVSIHVYDRRCGWWYPDEMKWGALSQSHSGWVARSALGIPSLKCQMCLLTCVVTQYTILLHCQWGCGEEYITGNYHPPLSLKHTRDGRWWYGFSDPPLVFHRTLECPLVSYVGSATILSCDRWGHLLACISQVYPTLPRKVES